MPYYGTYVKPEQEPDDPPIILKPLPVHDPEIIERFGGQFTILDVFGLEGAIQFTGPGMPACEITLERAYIVLAYGAARSLGAMDMTFREALDLAHAAGYTAAYVPYDTTDEQKGTMPWATTDERDLQDSELPF